MSSQTVVDVLLICALHAEYKGVIATTTGIDGEWTESTENGFTVAKATFTIDKTSTLSVVASYSPRMGESATIFTTGLLQHYKPRCVAMTGICAGKRGDTTLGDVIFADRVYRYDEGKQTADSFKADINMLQMGASWVQRFPSIRETMLQDLNARIQTRPRYTLEAQAFWILEKLSENQNPAKHADRATKCPDWEKALDFAKNKKWVDSKYKITKKGKGHFDAFSFEHPDGFPALPALKVHLAPIATGAAVRSDGEAFSEQAHIVRKILGIEMEIAGIANAAHQAKMPFVACKAVSDYGDAEKDDTFHHFGMRISAECMMYFLRHIDLPNVQNTHAEQNATAPATQTAISNTNNINQSGGQNFAFAGATINGNLVIGSLPPTPTPEVKKN